MQRESRTRNFRRVRRLYIISYVENAYFKPVKEQHIYIEVPFIYIIYIYRELFLASHPQANWLPLEDPLFARIGRFASDLFVRVYARLSVVLLPRLHHPPATILTPSRRSELFITLSTYVRVCVQICFFVFFFFSYRILCIARKSRTQHFGCGRSHGSAPSPPPIPCYCESR